jgi:hypothetical protein
MALSKEAIWEQVFPIDAELRVQRAFEMLLGDEFGLTDCARLGTAIDQCSCENYNQDDEKPAINVKRNCRTVKSIKKVNP